MISAINLPILVQFFLQVWKNNFCNVLFKKFSLPYNCSAHRSAHLFIIALSSQSHIKRKQPQITAL